MFGQVPTCLRFISNERYRERLTVIEITRVRRRRPAGPAYDSGGVGGGDDSNDDDDDDGDGERNLSVLKREDHQSE